MCNNSITSAKLEFKNGQEPKALVVLEALGMFNTLVVGDLQTKNNCVLVHSKGRPLHGMKAFVKFFNQNFP